MKTKNTKKIQIKKILSGGQTGVDLAALDIAIKHHIEYGGWCPKGRINESGIIPDKYIFFEEVSGDFLTEAENYAARTKKNTLHSDGTMILVPRWPLPANIIDGTILTIAVAKENNKPYLVVNLSKVVSELIQEFSCWVNQHDIQTLHVAGPRESSSPGIYRLSCILLEEMIAEKK